MPARDLKADRAPHCDGDFEAALIQPLYGATAFARCRTACLSEWARHTDAATTDPVAATTTIDRDQRDHWVVLMKRRTDSALP